jgi:hypothetical protein
LILNQYSVVYSNYNALVLSLRKHTSHGLELLFNYTYSKALDDGQTAGTNGTFFGTDGVLDPYDLEQDYSYSDLDQRHRFVGSVVWQPHFGNIKNAVTRQLVNGWSASGIVTAATGQPYNANIGTSILGSALPGDGGMTGAEVSTFSGPTGGRASWLPRNFYNLPNFTTVDFRLGRGISFAERYRLDFMVDAFNLFNSTIVSGVNTTAFTYSGAGSGACAGHTNGCLVPSPTFRTRATTSSTLYGARQLQFGARFEF